MSPYQPQQLREQALEVLKNNDLGGWTIPAPRLYPHLWNWDSVKAALGLSHSDPKRAWQEILSLLKGQWTNGMIPHMIFNPLAEEYEPGPKFWSSEQSPDAPKGMQTSGISQPPILAYGIYHIYIHDPDKKRAEELLKQVFPQLMFYYRFLLNERDPKREGLTSITHPWESGLDNSPRWQGPLDRMIMEAEPDVKRIDTAVAPPEQRPTNKEYRQFVYLVDLFKKEHYDQGRILKKGAFVVQDILFNSLMYASLEDLLNIAGILEEETAGIECWLRRSAKSLNTKLWDAERKMYIDYDLAADRPIVSNTVAQFIPLFAGFPSQEQAEAMVKKLTSSDFWPNNGGYPICSVAAGDPAFEPERMWKGPVWCNTNWMVIRGLERYGYHQIARKLTGKTLELVQKNAGSFTLIHTSFKALQDKQFPGSLLENLQDLQTREFATQDQLLSAVEARIGKEQMLRHAEALVECSQHGFYEHYHPFSGEGGGAKSFSWTASLVLDLLANDGDEPE